MTPPPDVDTPDVDTAVVKMLAALVALPPGERLHALVLVVKVVIEGHLPRFEDAFRRPDGV